jgi:predicted RND superfamily exporter protein
MSIRERLIRLLVRYPYTIMIVNLLLILALGAGVARLHVETGIDIFFAKDDPNLVAQQYIDETYGKEDNILFVIEAQDGDIFTPDILASIESITNQSWQMPNSRRVDSITNYLFPEVAGDDIQIAPLVEDSASLSATDIARVKDIAMSEQALVGRLLSPDGSVSGVNISLNLGLEQKATAVADSVTFAREIRDAVEKNHPGVSIYLAGWALTDQTLAEVTGADSVSLMPLLFVIVLVTLALLLRSAVASLCTVIVILLSIVVGMGFAGWMGIGLNSVNVSAPTIIMTLAVADCVHVLSSFLRQLRGGLDKREALVRSLQDTLYPVTLTSLTTALGFLSMNFSESPPFRDLGNIAAVGVIGALWVTVSILPGLVLLLPFKARTGVRTGVPMEALADFVIRHQRRLSWTIALLIVLVISFIPKLELNDDPSGYFSKDVPLHHAIDMVENRLSGTQSLHYSIDAGDSQGVTNTVFLQQVARFVEWLRVQPEVANVESFTDTLERLNQVMHDDAPQWHRLPDSNALAAQYVLLYEISVPYGQDVTHQVNAEKSALKVTAVVKNQKSQGLIAFEERTRAWFEQNAPEIVTRGAGQSLSFANIGMRNINSMLYGSLLALVLISLCLVVAFRSVRFGLISLVPNLFPAFVTLGLWSAFVGEVNIAASVVFSITLGIIVDDTTHFLVKYRDARCIQGLSAEDAIRYTFVSVGGALVSTSIVLAAGFLVLVNSDFSVNSTSGLLVALTILIAIVLDLFWLPALLIKADRWIMPAINPSGAPEAKR